MQLIKIFEQNGKTYAALRCTCCTYAVDLEIDPVAFQRWLDGEMIQNCFPEFDAGLRELFISGICGDCFDELFEDEIDEGPNPED